MSTTEFRSISAQYLFHIVCLVSSPPSTRARRRLGSVICGSGYCSMSFDVSAFFYVFLCSIFSPLLLFSFYCTFYCSKGAHAASSSRCRIYSMGAYIDVAIKHDARSIHACASASGVSWMMKCEINAICLSFSSSSSILLSLSFNEEHNLGHFKAIKANK